MALGDITWIDRETGEVFVPPERNGKELCKYIVDIFGKHDLGMDLTPEEVWAFDLKGGLEHLFIANRICMRLEGYEMLIEQQDASLCLAP